MKTVLVVVAHPDDEVLGCGGTIARHAAGGDQVHVLIVAEGATSRQATRNRDDMGKELSALAKSSRRAAEILGAASVKHLNFPDNRLDSIDLLDVIKAVETEASLFKPSVVYTHHPGDVNIDHCHLHKAVIAACRPQAGNTVRELLFFEVASSTEWQPPGTAHPFQPNIFVDIEATLEKKLAALSAYSSELRTFPHPRSLEAVRALAVWRGASAGMIAAEAFQLGRRLI